MKAKAGRFQVPVELPGTPYLITFGGSSGSGVPPVHYSGKLAFQPTCEIITPKRSAGSFAEIIDAALQGVATGAGLMKTAQ